MESYLLDWANLLLRWVHVITAIAWIGSSFYFVFLDSSLTPPEDEDLKQQGVSGVARVPAVAAGNNSCIHFVPKRENGGSQRCPGSVLPWCAALLSAQSARSGEQVAYVARALACREG